MSSTVLIDAIVRQTTILIAQLATSLDGRATFAHTANQIFSNLVRELKEQGVSNKGIADMFGLTLRSYHYKVSRLAESATERGKSVWEALYEFIGSSGTVSRADIFDRFRTDDERLVRGVLRELVDSGLVFRTGQGHTTAFRAAAADEMPNRGAELERLATLVCVAIKRFEPVTRARLAELVPTGEQELTRALEMLIDNGLVRIEATEPLVTYRCPELLVPLGTLTGIEAAVFDHYQALVTTVCAKLGSGPVPAVRGEHVGGSTYTFELDESHPLFDEAVGFLQATRDRAVELRRRINEINAHHPGGGRQHKVIAYVGQTVLRDEAEDF